MKSLAPLLAALAIACAASPRPELKAPTSVDDQSWRSQMPAPAPQRAIEYPEPNVTRLASGLQVWTLRRPAHVVEIALAIRIGQSSVPAGKSGLAALTARMLTEATQNEPALELAEAAESLGTTLDDDAGRDYSLVSLRVLATDLNPALDLLQEVVRQPRFASDDFERVRAEWLDSLVAERQSPQRLASLAGLRLLFGEPHGAPVAGGVSEVEKLAVTDVSDFHARAWRPEHAALIVVGDVASTDVVTAAERAFGDWRPPAATAALSAPPAPAPALPERPRVVVIDRRDSVQSAIFAAHPLPRRDQPGFEARQIVNGMVGGLFTSRLNQNLREKNAYTYGVRSQAIATRDWGAFVIATSVETNATAPALAEISKELEAARDPALGRPLAADEIARAKADLESSLGAHLESVDRVAADLVTLFSLSQPPDYWSKYGALVRAVPPEELAKQAREHLHPSRLLIVVVGDASKIEPALAKLPLTVERAKPELVD